MGIALVIFAIIFCVIFTINFFRFRKRKKSAKELYNHLTMSLNFFYSLGSSLLLFGLLWLIFLISAYFGDSNIDDSKFAIASLIGTVIMSVGLSFGIYMEQKVNSVLEKAELIEIISNNITEKLIEQLSENNIDDLSDKIVNKCADQIALKVRARPLRKQIAKQVAKKIYGMCK